MNLLFKCLCAILVLGLAGPSAARADEFDDHYGKAAVFYKAKQYEEAVAELKAAFKLKRLPRLLLSIANLQQNLGHSTEALSYYERYLRTEPNLEPKTRAEVEENMRRARALLGEEEKKEAVKKAPELLLPAVVPQVEPAPAPLLLAAGAEAPRAAASRPIYKRWWFWTAVGGAVAVGVALGAGLGARAGASSGTAGGTDFGPYLLRGTDFGPYQLR